MAQRITFEISYIVGDNISIEDAVKNIRKDFTKFSLEEIINERNITKIEPYK